MNRPFPPLVCGARPRIRTPHGQTLLRKVCLTAHAAHRIFERFPAIAAIEAAQGTRHAVNGIVRAAACAEKSTEYESAMVGQSILSGTYMDEFYQQPITFIVEDYDRTGTFNIVTALTLAQLASRDCGVNRKIA